MILWCLISLVWTALRDSPSFRTAPASCSLLDAKYASDPRLIYLDIARSLAAKPVVAVSCDHSQGYAHVSYAEPRLSASHSNHRFSLTFWLAIFSRCLLPSITSEWQSCMPDSVSRRDSLSSALSSASMENQLQYPGFLRTQSRPCGS